MKVRRFFRTPKGQLLIVLPILLFAAIAGSGHRGAALRLVAPGVIDASIAAMLVDAAILRYQKARWVFPDGALLTGLIVAMVLSPHQPPLIAAATAAVGVVGKYVIRIRTANVFNPAALGLVATFYVFNTGQSWWGALPEIAPAALAILMASGLFIAYRVNRLPATLSFLGVYYLCVTVRAFAGDPAHVAELFRAPDLHAALFFAFFMVTDPPTSPPGERDQLLFGSLVGVAGYFAFELIGAAYFLLAGLLVANVWEAWRRARAHANKLSVVHPLGDLQ